jgi:signal transduction histidine kinase/CheY-like chemotaxis protein
MLGPNDEYLGHVGMSLDVTERKQFEDALSEADTRKNEFLAMLAHELRNPLAPLRNSLEILRRLVALEASSAADAATPSESLDARARNSGGAIESVVQTMERQIGQLVRLVDDLLDVSRISRGRVELRRERVELASVMQYAIEAARPLFENMDQELTVTLPLRPVYVQADPTRLAQVVGNLLNNAGKYTNRGGRIWLTVEVAGAAPRCTAVIRVRDNGIGIDAEQLPRIFGMFVQVDTSLERSGSGLGIGLTLAKTLVEMHGGTVDVRSAGVGQGSEFIVRLPCMADDVVSAVPPATREPLAVTTRRVLIVDDNRDSADSLATLLRLSGHETRAAYDGLEAVEAAITFRPHAILMDIGLPKLNGYEAARRIRERSMDADLVLVALTGWGQESDRRRSEEAGFDAHLVKPVDDGILTRLLAHLSMR